MLPARADLGGSLGRVRFNPQPSAVGSQVATANNTRKKHDITSGDDVRGAVLAAARGRQSAAHMAIVVKLDHRDRLADQEPVTRNNDTLVESVVPGPEFLVLALGASGDLFNEVVL
jgi:hypothetical protein